MDGQLRETEQAITKAQKRVDRLTERLATATDHTELHTIGSDLATAQSELDETGTAVAELAELQST